MVGALEGEGGRATWCPIEPATNSTEPEVNQRLLKAVMSVVRSSEVESRTVVRCLTDLMKKPHSQWHFFEGCEMKYA